MMNSWTNVANLIGYVGVFMVLSAYFSLQINKLSAHGLLYSAVNLVGSVLILFSLYYHLNMASLVIEIAWFLISLYGLLKAIFRKSPEPPPSL